MSSSNSSSQQPQLVLGLLMGGTYRRWQEIFPESTPRVDFNLHLREAQLAEAAKLHTLFLADGVAASPATVDLSLEPSTLLSALAARTSHIGLIGSISTSFFEPYNVARQVGSLDLISNGRAGWNLVTSTAGEHNFGRELLPHDERYAVADEFAGVVNSLWESWDEDAVVADRENNVLIDPRRVHEINWVSPHFSVRGPLNVPRSPQGKPILAQAGSSEAGKNLGAKYADVIFTTGLTSTEDSIAVYEDIKSRAVAAGRSRDDIKILPGVAPVIASTDEEATRIWQDAYQDIDWDRARIALSGQFAGIGFEDLSLDAPIPVDKLPLEDAVQGRRSRYGVLRRLIERGTLKTVRDIVLYHASAAGHWFPIGSVENIADQLQQRWEAGGADGFNFLPFYNNYPHGLEAITEHLVPELQRRGIFQTEYQHQTLRANLGLPQRSLQPTA